MIKAIQTQYKGYNFRSRLEARWAVFFDALDVDWQYEPEGFDLPSGMYLPDFYLPNVDDGLWVEIKPVSPTRLEQQKIEDLALATGKNATFRVGEPMINVLLARGEDQQTKERGWDSDNAWVYCRVEADDDSAKYWAPVPGMEDSGKKYCGGADGPYLFCVCPWCQRLGFEFDGRGARVCGYRAHYKTEAEALAPIAHLGHHRVDDKCYTGDHPKILQAAYAARSARFEHGHSGATL
jgi:hypothetical protein